MDLSEHPEIRLMVKLLFFAHWWLYFTTTPSQTGPAAWWRPCCGLPESARHRLHPAESALHQCIRIKSTICPCDSGQTGAWSTYNLHHRYKYRPRPLKTLKVPSLTSVLNIYSSLNCCFPKGASLSLLSVSCDFTTGVGCGGGGVPSGLQW